jgi:hypothetical protein
MRSLYITGGQQKDDAFVKEEWHQHKKGLILRMDLETRDLEICAEYVTPPEARPSSDPSILFKCGTLEGKKLYVCTQTEVLTYELPHFDRVGYVSIPSFNDLHHVRPTADGTLLIANTGLDMVMEVDAAGNVLREWHVLGKDPWQLFSSDVDYRKVPTTKPHRAHPNYVFLFREEVWVTRFEQRDAVCLTRSGRRMAINIQRPHDGFVCGDLVYFTTVDGHIVIASLRDLKVKQIINLNEATGAIRALGWCRGLWVIDHHQVLVGFSRLRPTRWRENLRWMKGGIRMVASLGLLPTRIAMYDLNKGILCWEKDLESFGMNVIFSLQCVET